MMEKINYSWVFNDKKDRSSLWYIIALSIVIWLCIWGFLTKQYWMSLTILLLAWIIYFVENNSQDNIEIIISDLWIKITPLQTSPEIKWTFYNYNNINWYCFVYEDGNAIYLRLNLAKKWLKILDLKIDNWVLKELNKILPEFLEEKPKQELTFSEKIIHLLKL